jgi:hypothetical protein
MIPNVREVYTLKTLQSIKTGGEEFALLQFRSEIFSLYLFRKRILPYHL